MTINLFQTAEYRNLMREHLLKSITYLFDKEAEFAVASETKYVSFDPPLPEEIASSFQETVLFILSGYTFESAAVNEHLLSFEAGFGHENFGSRVTLPLLAIRQIFVGENPMVINHATPQPDMTKNRSDPLDKSATKQRSMEALLKNPENKKLLKKRK